MSRQFLHEYIDQDIREKWMRRYCYEEIYIRLFKEVPDDIILIHLDKHIIELEKESIEKIKEVQSEYIAVDAQLVYKPSCDVFNATIALKIRCIPTELINEVDNATKQ